MNVEGKEMERRRRPSFSDVACCLRGSHKSSETWVGQLQRLRVNSSPGAVGFSESKGSQIIFFLKSFFAFCCSHLSSPLTASGAGCCCCCCVCCILTVVVRECKLDAQVCERKSLSAVPTKDAEVAAKTVARNI